MGRKEAAEYLGIGESTFSLWVSTHKMPPAIPGTRKWDRRAIDAKLDEISGLAQAGDPMKDTFARWEREKRAASSPRSHGTDVAKWREQKEKRRAKYRPKMDLNAKLERTLLHIAAHPECDTAASIPGAGIVLLDELISVGAVRLVGAEKEALRYALTEEGEAEAKRIKKWRALAPD
jgi:hypothetical protein